MRCSREPIYQSIDIYFATFETCIVLNGLITDIIYDNYSDEVVSYHLVAIGENCGVQIPAG